MKRWCILWIVPLLAGGTVNAQDYLLRIRSLSPSPEQATHTVELHAAAGRPFFLRSTFANQTQFLIRGILRKLDDETCAVEYDCQQIELGSDPLPRQQRSGMAKVIIHAEEQRVSTLEAKNEDAAANLDFLIALRPLHPVFGSREASSRWAVRLIDAAGEPVSGVEAGLFGPQTNESDWEPLVHSKSDRHGVVRFTEGRESLTDFTFYAVHEGRKLFAAAHLDPQQFDAPDRPFVTVEMNSEFKRWSKPKQAPALP